MLFCPPYPHLLSIPGTPLSNIKWSWLRVEKNTCWELGGLNLIISCWSNHKLSYTPTCKTRILVVSCSRNGIQAQELTLYKYLRKCSQIYIMLEKCKLSVFSLPSGLNLIVSWDSVKYNRFWHVKFPSMWLCSLHYRHIKNPFEVKVGEIIILPDKNSWSTKIMT